VFCAPVVLNSKASNPTPTLLLAVVFDFKELLPTATLEAPLVFAVKALKPIAVLLAPVTAASKAFSPRTVLPATEFAPLPTVTEFMVASAEPTIPPVTDMPVEVVSSLMELSYNKRTAALGLI